jgi:hypothetical protein
MKSVVMITLLATGAILLAQNPAVSGWPRATHKLPDMNGKQLQITQVEVRYAPGQASPSHSHPCPVLVRVVEGAVRSQVDDNPETVYKGFLRTERTSTTGTWMVVTRTATSFPSAHAMAWSRLRMMRRPRVSRVFLPARNRFFVFATWSSVDNDPPGWESSAPFVLHQEEP